MAVLQECPACHWKGSVKKKVCRCGLSFDKAKKSKKVRFWIQYRDQDGRQRKEFIGTSVSEARDADSKKKVLKRENRPVFDILPESKMTFKELAEWYLGLEKVKALKSYWLAELTLKKFNSAFGDRIVNTVKLADLENYQIRRLKEGKAPGTVDHEIGKARTMVIKAFENDMVGGDVMKVFTRCKKTLKPGSDIRDRILSKDEFEALVSAAPRHLRPIIATGYYTGMRRGEILGLTWDKVDLRGRVIRLSADMTKDSESRTIPICEALYNELKAIPRAIHKPHVFMYRGKSITCIRTGLRKACQAAGIVYGRFEEGGFIFHDLRHTFNTNMRKAGVAESVIMAITGHSTREMFDRYNRIDDDDTKVAVTQLESYLGNVTQTVTQEAV